MPLLATYTAGEVEVDDGGREHTPRTASVGCRRAREGGGGKQSAWPPLPLLATYTAGEVEVDESTRCDALREAVEVVDGIELPNAVELSTATRPLTRWTSTRAWRSPTL